MSTARASISTPRSNFLDSRSQSIQSMYTVLYDVALFL